MSQTSPQSSDPRSVVRYACVAAAITIVLLWTLYLVRAPLLLIYVSALFATGLAPLVRIIERQRVRAIGRRRVPRGAAILAIYATVLGGLAGLGAAVIPPLVQQSQQFWKALPDYMDQAQQRLTSWGLISPDASFKDLLQQAPAGGGDAVGVVMGALWGFVGGIFGIISILLLTFYMLVDVSAVGVDSDAIARELLTERHVATAPGTTFGAQGAGLLRISLAADQGHIEEGCRRIVAFVRERSVTSAAASAARY